MKLDRESYEHYLAFFAQYAAADRQEAVRLAAFDAKAAAAYTDGVCTVLLRHANGELPEQLSSEKLTQVVASIAASNLKMLAIIEAARDYDSVDKQTQE